MRYPALHAYLERLATGEAPSSSLRQNGDGEVQGHIFNCWLGSAFHPIRELECRAQQLRVAARRRSRLGVPVEVGRARVVAVPYPAPLE